LFREIQKDVVVLVVVLTCMFLTIGNIFHCSYGLMEMLFVFSFFELRSVQGFNFFL
jgi:hypothetical protein